MARYRDQEGHLKKTKTRQPKWWAQWRAYDLKDRAVRRSAILGLVADMSEAEARRKLLQLIAEENGTGYALRDMRTPRSVARVGRLSEPTQSTPGAVGAIAELAVCVDLMERGYDVFRAQSPTACCDLISVKDGVLARIEVKSSNSGSTNLRRNVGKFDILAVVSRDGTITYSAHHAIKDALYSNPENIEKSSLFGNIVAIGKASNGASK